MAREVLHEAATLLHNGLALDGLDVHLGDLGGLPLDAGGRTRPNRVYRSAAPEWMTHEGWDHARAVGLSTVIDLRNEMERGRSDVHPVLGRQPAVLPGQDRPRARCGGLAFDARTGEWVPQADESWSEEELDAALADRRPTLTEWLRTFDVEAYLGDSGMDQPTLLHLRGLLVPDV